MISQTKVMRAINLGDAIAMHTFILMINPDCRGPAFEWGKLEDIAVRQVRVQVLLCNVSKREAKEFEDIAVRSCKASVRECIEESGVRKWLKLGGEK